MNLLQRAETIATTLSEAFDNNFEIKTEAKMIAKLTDVLEEFLMPFPEMEAKAAKGSDVKRMNTVFESLSEAAMLDDLVEILPLVAIAYETIKTF